MKSLKIVFFGTPEFAKASLEAIHKSHHQVVAVVTVADKAAGRGQKILESPVKQFAIENNLAVFQPEKLRNTDFLISVRQVNAEFLVINLINVITPNADGHNDFLDYSDLRIKDNVLIQIFDRNGTKVFESDNRQLIWDGKLNGRTLPTATYWYVLSWAEPETGLPALFHGWILLKNRLQ